MRCLGVGLNRYGNGSLGRGLTEKLRFGRGYHFSLAYTLQSYRLGGGCGDFVGDVKSRSLRCLLGNSQRCPGGIGNRTWRKVSEIMRLPQNYVRGGFCRLGKHTCGCDPVRARLDGDFQKSRGFVDYYSLGEVLTSCGRKRQDPTSVLGSQSGQQTAAYGDVNNCVLGGGTRRGENRSRDENCFCGLSQ